MTSFYHFPPKKNIEAHFAFKLTTLPLNSQRHKSITIFIAATYCIRSQIHVRFEFESSLPYTPAGAERCCTKTTPSTTTVTITTATKTTITRYYYYRAPLLPLSVGRARQQGNDAMWNNLINSTISSFYTAPHRYCRGACCMQPHEAPSAPLSRSTPVSILTPHRHCLCDWRSKTRRRRSDHRHGLVRVRRHFKRFPFSYHLHWIYQPNRGSSLSKGCAGTVCCGCMCVCMCTFTTNFHTLLCCKRASLTQFCRRR